MIGNGNYQFYVIQKGFLWNCYIVGSYRFASSLPPTAASEIGNRVIGLGVEIMLSVHKLRRLTASETRNSRQEDVREPTHERQWVQTNELGEGWVVYHWFDLKKRFGEISCTPRCPLWLHT
jgi:hypothetical protein